MIIQKVHFGCSSFDIVELPGYQELLLFWQILLHTRFISCERGVKSKNVILVWLNLQPTAKKDNGEPGKKSDQCCNSWFYLRGGVDDHDEVDDEGEGDDHGEGGELDDEDYDDQRPSDPLQPRTPLG